MADWTKLISLIVLLWLFGSFDNVDYFFFLGSSEFGCRLKRMKISVYIFEDQTKKNFEKLVLGGGGWNCDLS